MTTGEFLDALERVHAQFEWALDPATNSPSEPDTPPRLQLRTVPKDGAQPATALDPLGAVCYSRTGQVFGPESWPDAGEALGIVPSDSAMLFAASSDRVWTRSNGERKPLPILLSIRVRMIETVGLTARTN